LSRPPNTHKMVEEEVPLPILFHDVTPIPQEDGPHPVCAISYKEDFTEAMNYLRAVLRANELSARALKLTSICLKLNPANYTVWHFRRRCLQNLSSSPSTKFAPESIQSDLEFSSKLGGSNPKNYQIWYHRRALLEPTFEAEMIKQKEGKEKGKEDEDDIIQKAKEELNYINGVLENDGKNYHAWSHRQWVLRTICFPPSIYNSELDYVHKLILDDPRNNSAWNHRWFITHKGCTRKPLSSLEDVQKEITYAMQCAEVDPFNESPWRYVIGFLEECKKYSGSEGNDVMEAADVKSLINSCEQEITKMRGNLGSTEYDVDSCVHLTSAKIDILEMKGDDISLEQAANLAKDLETEHDLIRKKYWKLREKEIRSRLSGSKTDY